MERFPLPRLTCSRQEIRSASDWLSRFLAVSIALLAAFNAWHYSAMAAGPLLQADSWYFLDAFLSKYLDGTLRWSDLFIQRGGDDHSQPLHKLILLFHTRFFDMDFRVEGLIGTAIGISWCAVVGLLAWRWRSTESMHPAAPLVLSFVFFFGLSINSSNVFTWSLVSLAYLPLLLGTLYFAAFLRWADRRAWAYVALSTFLLGILIDEVAIIVVLATLLTGSLFADASMRAKAIAAGYAFAGLVAARIVLALISGGGSGSDDSGGSLMSALLSREALRGFLIPFADGAIHYEHLQRIFPDTTGRVFVLVAAALILLHICFWMTALSAVRARRNDRNMMLAVFLMLVAYALTAGIVIGRVPVFGWSYLHQPRYVLFYQVSLVAMAIQLFHALSIAPPSTNPVRKIAKAILIGGVAVLLVTLQVFATRASWSLPRYLTPYWQNAAAVMHRLGQNPEDTTQCPDILAVCEYSADTRQRLMRVLTENQLNIFSGGFQMRNRLYPTMASVPALAPVHPDPGTGEQVAASEDADASGDASVALSVVAATTNCAEEGLLHPARVGLEGDPARPRRIQLWGQSGTSSRRLLLETEVGAPARLATHLVPGTRLAVTAGDSELAEAIFEAPSCP